MRIILFAFFLLTAITFANAQDKGLILGKLADSTGKQSLALATITVFKAKDTAIITYRLSDPQGAFKVPGLPLNVPCRAVISFSGYHAERKEFTLTEQTPQIDFGTIHLTNTAQSLDEVLVIAERPPVSVRKDTIEFNATAFKTLPTALVEDLLKKLPGVDVDKDGNITANGRPVNRILVDGKNFFGGDPKVATRNLPANIIDKVQVTDDKDQLDENPDINKSQLGQVINLRLKKSIKQGWFGKAYAGAGTDDRHEAGGILNLFRDTLQVSLLGYANNLNKAGFGMNDVVQTGGFNRSGFNSISISSDGGFALNGISFGGLGQGIVRSEGGGTNINTELSKKVSLNLQYFYGHNNSQFNQLSNTQQFFDDTVFTTRSTTRQESDEYTHRIGGSLRWKPDASTNIRFEPQLNLRKTVSERNLLTTAFSNYEPLLNESNNNQRLRLDETGYSHNFSYNHNFAKKERTLYISHRLSIGNTDNNQYNDIEDTFYKTTPYSNILNQLRDRDGSNFSTNLQVNYNEPLSKSLGLRFTNNIEYFKDKDLLNTYNKQPSGDTYDVYNVDLSNGVERSGIRNTTNTGLKWTVKKWTITPGLSVQSLNIENKYIKNPDLPQHFVYLMPNLSVNFKELSLSYNVNIKEPQATDLQPVTDNTNTLYQQLGNPTLVPTRSNNINLNYNKYNTKNGINVYAYINGSIDENAVIRERTVDNTGVQITRPINVDGIWRFNTNLSLSKQFKLKSNWQLTLRGSFWGDYNRNIIIVNSNRSTVKNWRINPSASFSFNWNDKLEFNQRYVLGYSSNKYASNAFTDLDIVNHYSLTELIVRVPKHWVWESTFDYIYNPQTAPGVRKANLRWNAGINFLFLKEDKGQLKLSAYDLLNQNISVTRTTKENYIQDNQTTVLQRYFMLTFTYNIRNIGPSKVGGREKLFFF